MKEPEKPDITERAARSSGRAGTAASRLARESRIFRAGARKSCAIIKSLIYKYICRKMIYFAIKTA